MPTIFTSENLMGVLNSISNPKSLIHRRKIALWLNVHGERFLLLPAFNVLSIDLKKVLVSSSSSFLILALIVKLELSNICINLYGLATSD